MSAIRHACAENPGPSGTLRALAMFPFAIQSLIQGSECELVQALFSCARSLHRVGCAMDAANHVGSSYLLSVTHHAQNHACEQLVIISSPVEVRDDDSAG